MCASTDSLPVAVTRSSSRPLPLMLPPVTLLASLGHRQRFASQHRLINLAGPSSAAICRNAFAGAHRHVIAVEQLADRHVLLGQSCRSGCATSGRNACSARIAVVVRRLARASKPFAQQHQRHHHRRALK